MYLRDAAEGVGVLYVLLVACYQLAALEQLAEVACRFELAAVGAHLVNRFVEGFDAAVEGVERHGADFVGALGQAACVHHAPYAERAHELRAVQQCQPLFGLEFDGLPTELFQHFGCRYIFPFEFHFAQAEQRERHVGERSEVARCTQRPLLVDDGQDAVVEEVDEPFHGRYLYARMTVGERLDFQQQNQADDFRRNPFARSAGVRHDEVFLEFAQTLLVYRDVAQRTEAGRYAVNRCCVLLFGLAVEIVAAALDARARIVRQFEPVSSAGNFVGLLRSDVCG